MISVKKIGKTEWASMAAPAHRCVFEQLLPPSQLRMDFALLTVDSDTDTVLTYITCRELDSKTLYMGYGGSFPSAKETFNSWLSYVAVHEFCKESGYTQIFKMIENTNKVMLKFAAKMGYLIMGLRQVSGSTMLEHCLEFKDAA